MIQKMPLQLYSSALLFTPTCSTVGRNFEHEKPGWVTLKPETRSWNPYFHLLGGHQGGIHHLSWAPDKKHVVTTSTNDQLIKLWDLTAGHCVMSLKGHSTYITSLAWSYDGNLLAATSYGGELKVWDPATGQCLLTISVPDVPLYSVFWSQDRTELVTVSWGLESEKSTQLSVNVWDGITGQCKMTLSPDEAQVKSVIPSFDGKSFIYFSSGGVKSWKLSHDQKIHSQHVSNGLSSEGILSHDGKSLVHSEGNVIKIFDPSTCEVTAILESGLQVDSTVRYLAFCHDDMKLASGFKNGIIEIWDLVTRQCISVLEGHSDKILTILWLKDGRVASGSDDATMRLWNPSTGQCLSTLKAQGSEPKDFILSSDETQFITTSSTDGSIKSWDMNASQPLDEHRRSVEILVLSRDGVHLASGSEDGTIKIWSRSNGQCITSFEEHTDYVLDLQWSPTGKIASVSLDQTIKIWDPLTGQCLHTIEKPCQWSSSMCWSADGSRLMFVTYENSVVEWDAITGQQLETRKTEHTGQNAKWSLDGTRFASTTEGSRIIVQDASTGLIVSDLSGFEDEFESLVDVPLCLRRAVQMCWSNDGAQLASVLGPTIKIWDTATGDCILVLELDQEPGSFHFSQGPSFSEPDSGYLHTSIGSFNIQSYMDLTSGSASSRLVCSPQPEGQGLDPSLQCVTRDGVNMMALPEDYIARHTDSMVIMGNTVVIGSTTGRVSILEFSESSSLSGMSSLKIRP